MATLLRELRQALRGTARDRSFTLTALLLLALALSATTVIWSLADAVILRPLPYPASARLVSVGNDWAGAFAFEHASQSLLEMEDVATLDEVFDQVAAYRSQSYNFTAGEGEPVRIEGVAATGVFFDILQVPAPAHGGGALQHRNARPGGGPARGWRTLHRQRPAFA